MSNEQAVPPIPSDLMAWLDRIYPERSPDPKDAEREIWMKAGERRLVRKLLLHHKRQEETIYVRNA